MRKVILTSLVITLFLSIFSVTYANPIQLEAETAILIDSITGEILYEKNKDKQKYPASTTKMITGILAIENGNLKDIVTIDEETPFIEGSKIYLIEDEKLTVEQLINALLIESANDSADALAKYIAGSVEDFAVLMNEKAKELGAKNTNFVNPHGLPDDNHLTTAYDLAMIAKYAMENDLFREIVGKITYTIPKTEKQDDRYFKNRNRLMWDDTTMIPYNGTYDVPYYEYATGIKTGYTDDAGYCLVASAQYGNREVISVVLNSKPNIVFMDTKALLDYGLFQFKNEELVKANGAVETISVIGGKEKTINLVAQNNLTVTMPVDQNTDSINKTITYNEDIKAPIKQGDIHGKVEAIFEGKVLATVALISEVDVTESLVSKVLDNLFIFWTKFKWPILIIAGIIVVYIILSLNLSFKRKKRRKMRKRKYDSTQDFVYKSIIK